MTTMLLDAIIGDKSKFKEVLCNSNKHPLIAKEDSIAYYVRKYLKKHYDSRMIANLIPSGSSPGKLYGTVKVHKPNFPLRPVVSMVNTPEYALAKFLDNMIKPYLPQTRMLKSTDHFIEELKEFNPNSQNTMVSFDVISLFTNVPLVETIDIIINRLYDEHNNNSIPIPKDIFKKLVLLATQGIFMHNERFYKQVEGIIMGNPLGPTMANFFMAHLEEKIFAEKSNGPVLPKLYLRYIDDVYAIFDSNQNCDEFLPILNAQHQSVKFTVEKATDSLPFLDVEIKFDEFGFKTRVWRKPTYTELLLNFRSTCPNAWKSGLITCLLKRAKIICSDYELFKDEITKLRCIFAKNCYPNWFFNKCLKKFENDTKPDSLDKEVDDYLYILGLPYFGRPSRKFASQLSTLLKQKFDVRIFTYYTSLKTGSYFNLKSKTPAALKSNVVYKFTCSRDVNTTYIGMSTRHLVTRAREHLQLNSTSAKSAISQHISSCQTCQNSNLDVSSFKVIRNCHNEYETKIQEALLIKKLTPRLNSQLYANGCSFPLNVF